MIFCVNKQMRTALYVAISFVSEMLQIPKKKVITSKIKNANAVHISTPEGTIGKKVVKYCDKHQIVHHDWPPCTTLCQEFDVGIVSSFGHLIPSNIIDSFSGGTYNVHGSLLPKYRGAAPIIHALLNGDSSTGVTIMEVRPEKFDIGDIIAKEEFKIMEDD